jgi:hypothetical protein
VRRFVDEDLEDALARGSVWRRDVEHAIDASRAKERLVL